MPVGAAHEARKSTQLRYRPPIVCSPCCAKDPTLTKLASCQSVRRYATQPPSSTPPPSGGGGSGNAPFLALGAAAVGGAAYYFYAQNPGAAQKAESKLKEALPAGAGGVKKALTGGDQGFISLKLEDVEHVNHNTKKFRFKLPEEDQVSGLSVASALLTKFKPEDGKPVLRPYTPTSDEGAYQLSDVLGG